MDYIKEFGKLIDLAEKQRREIVTLKSRYEKAADEIKASYNSGLLGDRGLQETLVMMQEEETRKITHCQESILQAGADVLRIAKLETIPNAKMLDSDIMAILNSGIDLTRDDWESYIHEQRHNPTMVRALR